MGLKALVYAQRAPYITRFSLGGGTPTDYGFDNLFVMKWRNAAKTADLDVMKVDASDYLQVLKTIHLEGITPSTETFGSLFTTGSTWVAFSTANACGFKALLSNTSTSGEFATMRMRARSNSATATVCGNFAASAGQNDFGDLYAVQGYAQPLTFTQATASNIVCAVYSCVQATASSSGRRWSTWIDTHATTKAAGGDYMLRISHNGNGGVPIDGAITIYSGGRLPVLFNFEDVVGGGFLTDADASLVTMSGALKVTTPAGTKCIPLYDYPS